MKKLLLLITGLLLLFSVEGQILRYSNYTAPAPPEPSVDSANWEDEYKVVYYAMTTPPQIDTADFQNRMVRRLVDSSLWAGVELMYVLANRDASDALINWANPGTYNLSQGAAGYTHVAYDGFYSDGDGYLTTGYNTSTNADKIGVDDVTIAIYNTTATASGDVAVGVSDGTQMIQIYSNYTGPAIRTRMCNGTNVDAVVASGIGFSAVTRRGDTDVEIYKNGSSVGTSAEASLALPNQTVYVLANNNNGNSGGVYVDRLSIVILMDGITDEEAATLFDIIEEYMDAIGSGVVE